MYATHPPCPAASDSLPLWRHWSWRPGSWAITICFIVACVLMSNLSREKYVHNAPSPPPPPPLDPVQKTAETNHNYVCIRPPCPSPMLPARQWFCQKQFAIVFHIWSSENILEASHNENGMPASHATAQVRLNKVCVEIARLCLLTFRSSEHQTR